MKNNMTIIVIVTIVALGVIILAVCVGASKKEKGRDNSSAPSYSTSDSGTKKPDAIDVSYSKPDDTSAPVMSESSAAPEPLKPVSSSSSSSSREYPPEYIGDRIDADNIVMTAKSQLDVPFVMGGESPSGFDSPGFVCYVLRRNGFPDCAHNTERQAEMGKRISRSELREGDLVFFWIDDRNEPGFSGIYIGDDTMIACIMPTNRDPGVMTVDITQPYYVEHFYCAVSLT